MLLVAWTVFWTLTLLTAITYASLSGCVTCVYLLANWGGLPECTWRCEKTKAC